MTLEEINIKATAYHEAGHAVMYVAVGIEFVDVTINPEGETLGHVTGHTLRAEIVEKLELNDMPFDHLVKSIMILGAGPLAEGKFLGKDVEAGHYFDLEEMVDYADALIQDTFEQEAFFKWIEIRTRKQIDLRWNQIVAVAYGLLSHKTLSYQGVIDLVTPIPFVFLEP